MHGFVTNQETMTRYHGPSISKCQWFSFLRFVVESSSLFTCASQDQHLLNNSARRPFPQFRTSHGQHAFSAPVSNGAMIAKQGSVSLWRSNSIDAEHFSRQH